jgi:hypothetical protein
MNKKLFTTRYGSWLYGTNTPESDEDYKHIILPSLDGLLIGKRIKNKVDKTNTEKFVKNTAEDIDKENIPIQILAKDFLGGQTYALELAFAVDFTKAHQVIHDERIIPFCHELRSKFLTSNMTALIGYSVNQASLYSLKGERLNAIREVKALFEDMISRFGFDKKPNEDIELFENKAKTIELAFPKYVSVTTYAIDHEGTMRPCLRLLEKTLPYTNTFKTNLNTVNTHLKKYGSRADAASIDNVDWKATMHSLRVVNEGISLLKEKSLTFPFDGEYIELLLSIKRGELPYPVVIELINEKLDLLKTLELESDLPIKTHELTLELEAWLAKWMRVFYEI